MWESKETVKSLGNFTEIIPVNNITGLQKTDILADFGALVEIDHFSPAQKLFTWSKCLWSYRTDSFWVFYICMLMMT